MPHLVSILNGTHEIWLRTVEFMAQLINQRSLIALSDEVIHIGAFVSIECRNRAAPSFRRNPKESASPGMPLRDMRVPIALLLIGAHSCGAREFLQKPDHSRSEH